MTTALVIAAVYFVCLVVLIVFIHGAVEVPEDVEI